MPSSPPPPSTKSSSSSNNGQVSPPSATTTGHTHAPLRSAMKHSSSHSRPVTPGGPGPSSPRTGFVRSESGSGELTPGPGSGGFLLPSPVTSGYTPKVSFDTFENPSEEGMFSYTLQVKTDSYIRTHNTRVFLCAASNDESGSNCLEWVLESLVQDGDELVVLRGFDSDILGTQQDLVRQDAKELMSHIQSRNMAIDPDRRLSLIVEFVAGKVTQTIERLIALYRPDSLVVGTRGQRGVIQTWGAALQLTRVGSVSKWCLSHSPVPVIVVRPERKVRKAIEKRRADPKRGTMFDTPRASGMGSLPHTKSLQ